MQSQLVELFPPTVFKFSDIAFDNMADKSIYFAMVQRIPTRGFCEGELVVRVYDNSIQNSNDRISVALLKDPYTPDSPGQLWEADFDQEEAELAAIDVVGEGTTTVLYASISSGLSNMAKVYVAGVRSQTSGATNTIEARLDASLVLKSCS